MLIALSILDHRLAVRHRYDDDPEARAAYLELAYAEVRAALDGVSIEQILESRAA
jgi:hypothetical protein